MLADDFLIPCTGPGTRRPGASDPENSNQSDPTMIDTRAQDERRAADTGRWTDRFDAVSGWAPEAWSGWSESNREACRIEARRIQGEKRARMLLAADA